MAQQQLDPQRTNEPRDGRRREKQFPAAEDRPNKVQGHQPNREGGGRTRDQGGHRPQPPDRKQTRE
jgi:hypothetical protein